MPSGKASGNDVLGYWDTVGSNEGTLHLEAKFQDSSDNTRTPCHNVKLYILLSLFSHFR